MIIMAIIYFGFYIVYYGWIELDNNEINEIIKSLTESKEEKQNNTYTGKWKKYVIYYFLLITIYYFIGFIIFVPLSVIMGIRDLIEIIKEWGK